MSIWELIEQLVDTFERDIRLAKSLESCNPQDDLAIKAAVVGFSYNAPTPDWAQDHYEFVKHRLERDYHDEELVHEDLVGPGAESCPGDSWTFRGGKRDQLFHHRQNALGHARKGAGQARRKGLAPCLSPDALARKGGPADGQEPGREGLQWGHDESGVASSLVGQGD